MRKIELTITNCSECPYLEYDADYGMSYNSGYDCKLTGDRIASDIGSKIQDLTLLPIPGWCPLEKTGLLEERKKKIKKLMNK